MKRLNNLILILAALCMVLSFCAGASNKYANEGLWLFIIAGLLVWLHVSLEIRERK